MAKRENTVKGKKSSGAKSKKKRSGKKSSNSKLADALDFIRSEQFRKISAIALILFSLFLLVAFVSHFFTGHQDQSVVSEGALGNPELEQPSNWLGSIGAWFAFKFISRGFGIMGILIPLFGLMFGFIWLENNWYKIAWRTFKYVVFGLVWGSPFLAFMSFMIVNRNGDLGGGFGGYLNETLFNYIGRVGVGILLTLIAAVFLILEFNPEFNLLKWASAKVPSGSGEEAEKDAGTDDGDEKTSVEKKEGFDTVTEKEIKKADEKEEKDNDFVISVTNGSETKNGTVKKEELIKETVTEDGTVVLDPVVIAKADTPSPEGDGLELEIEAPKEESEEVTPDLEGDNIVKTDADKFEKFVPDEDKETVDADEDVGDWEQFDPTKELSDYQFPTIDLLNQHDNQSSREVNRAELETNKNKIVETLRNYKIDITHIKATIGPTVTLYEIVPAPGVRISKIRNLEDDIALSLAALGIRIIAPIPGKGTIGIEIPNSNPEIVSMRSTLATEKFKSTKAELPIALGRTISNEVFIADLAKMPHLLIAGATGQGKSVGINGLITSLLYKKHPAQIKFVLIDPKKVELNLYAALEKHFLAKLPSYEDAIITDTKQVIYVLNSLCIEMDERYDLLKKAKVRNIKEYNDKFTNRRLNPKKGHRYMPYIVLIIDEFADLMMTAGKEIETPIARLAQLARAIGIHLVLATQRPSVNVITGIIKANFPARLSFRVTSKVDSRTILDAGGADQLIGRGDMLFSTGSELVRIQNSFIDTPEVDHVVEFIETQRGYSDAYYLPEVPDESESGSNGELTWNDLDDLFEEAAKLIVNHQQGSTSLIQRRLSLGYNRAGRIIDQLEQLGIVGPFSGSKARDVLVKDEFGLQEILNTIK